MSLHLTDEKGCTSSDFFVNKCIVENDRSVLIHYTVLLGFDCRPFPSEGDVKPASNRWLVTTIYLAVRNRLNCEIIYKTRTPFVFTERYEEGVELITKKEKSVVL